MKKIISMCVALVMLLALALPIAAEDILLISPAPSSLPQKWDGTVAEAFGGGTGTEADPYLITNAKELALIAKNVNDQTTNYKDVYFKQVADINLDGAAWESIGNGKTAVAFAGNYDGGNFTIYNILNVPIDINDASTMIYNGLFGWITDPAVIQNIKMVGGSVTSTKFAAAIVGFMTGGTVYNCVSDIDNIYGIAAGGIVGRAEKGERNLIRGCVNHSSIAVPADQPLGKDVFLGGIIGAAGNTDIIYCANYGDVTSEGTNYSLAGGIVGIQGASSGTVLIDNCVDMGKMHAIAGNAKNVGAGGICGKAAHVSFSEIYNCFTAGTYTTDKENYAGGIAGFADGAKFVTVDNLYTTSAKAAGTDEMGQLADTTILTLAEMKGPDGIAKMKLNSAWVAEADMIPSIDVAKIDAAEAEPEVPAETTTEATTTVATTEATTATTTEVMTEATTEPAPEVTTEKPAVETAPIDGDVIVDNEKPADPVAVRDNTALIVILSIAIVADAAAMVAVMLPKKRK